MVGDEAAPYRAMLELNHPVEEGIVKDWNDMELIWRYAFEKVNSLFNINKMKINYSSSSILMTEAVLNPESNRIKMAELIFEKFGFNKMQIGI